ncbi:MAG: hypothetical protein ACFCVB_05740 [Nodosilinea sp.]
MAAVVEFNGGSDFEASAVTDTNAPATATAQISNRKISNDN